MTERSRYNAERLMQGYKADIGWKPLNRYQKEGSNRFERFVAWMIVVCITTEVVWQLHLYLQRH